ncbi:uncharacterized protein LOC129601571 [Paramacrobiotus metropolitanus]|uniref:uncharacterized protein LOC129601571 n=1 Tax=Paramacrobiotus metropolitanus TaxID=2943436 RepID=UPI002446305A|nr:uncharacterized protein LOC129601571 [Paramacrobiotus metropolitanus]
MVSLQDDFAESVCRLPEQYDGDEYVAFLKRFGTHMIETLLLVKQSRTRVFVDPKAIFQHLVRSGTTFTGDSVHWADGIQLRYITDSMLVRIADDLMKGPRSDSVVNETAAHNITLPVHLLEISQLLDKVHLNRSLNEICRQLFDGMSEANQPVWLKTVADNLYRAMDAYSNEAQTEQPIATPQITPWPKEIRSQIRAIQTRNFLAGQRHPCVSDAYTNVLGHGYDLLRADPLGTEFHAGIHSGEPILRFKDCPVTGNCNDTVLCTTLPPTGHTQEKHIFRAVEEYQDVILSTLDIDGLDPVIHASVGMRSPIMRSIRHGATINDTFRQSYQHEMRYVYNKEDLFLDSHLLSTACSLPDLYDPAEYISFLKHFGTHIITRVRYGSFALNRTVHYADMEADTSVLETSIRPLQLTVKNIKAFFTPLTISQSAVPPDCDKLLNASSLQSFRKLLDRAIVEYATTMGLPTTTTISTTTTTTTAAATSPTTTTINPVVFLPHGTIQGVVRDADSLDYLPGVSVTARLPRQNFQSTRHTNAKGDFSMSLPSMPSYDLHFELPGYYPALLHGMPVTVQQTLVVEPMLYINQRFTGIGTASGNVTNAVTSQTEPGVLIHFRSGINVLTGDVAATATTLVSGRWTVTLPTGHYTATLSKPEFAPTAFTVVILGGMEKPGQNHVIVPVVSRQQWRFVLHWGEWPLDLDLHVWGPIEGNRNQMHVYWYSKLSPGNHTDLDVDVTKSYGPETVTVRKQLQGVYTVKVHDYTNREAMNSPALGVSGAELVYRGSMQLGHYYVPRGHGTTWSVLQLNGTQIQVINRMSHNGLTKNVDSS